MSHRRSLPRADLAGDLPAVLLEGGQVGVVGGDDVGELADRLPEEPPPPNVMTPDPRFQAYNPSSPPPSSAIAQTTTEWARLQNAFPTGVCDYSKPGVYQQPTVPWLTYQNAQGQAEPRSAPHPSRPPSDVEACASAASGRRRDGTLSSRPGAGPGPRPPRHPDHPQQPRRVGRSVTAAGPKTHAAGVL